MAWARYFAIKAQAELQMERSIIQSGAAPLSDPDSHLLD